MERSSFFVCGAFLVNMYVKCLVSDSIVLDEGKIKKDKELNKF